LRSICLASVSIASLSNRCQAGRKVAEIAIAAVCCGAGYKGVARVGSLRLSKIAPFNGELDKWSQALEWRSSLRMAIQIGVEERAYYRVRD